MIRLSSRIGRWWPWALCLALVTLPIAGMRRVPHGGLLLRESAFRTDRVLGPGWHVVLPVAERLFDLNPYNHASKIGFLTPEGARLDVDLRVVLHLSPEGTRRLLES